MTDGRTDESRSAPDRDTAPDGSEAGAAQDPGQYPGEIGRVVRAQSGFHHVHLADESTVMAVLRGRLKQERQSEGLVVVGDRVRVQRLDQPEGESGLVDAVIVERLPRDSALIRRAPGPKGRWAQDVVVANIDLLVPTLSTRDPRPSPRMLDRFLALAECAEIESVIVVTKVDLGIDETLRSHMAEYERIGYEVCWTSAETGQGIDDLASYLAGKTSALVGPSGVGKSSLLNRIAPGLDLRVGAVSEAVHKGRHTTRVGELHPLPEDIGGWVADTPGLREIGVWEVDPAELEWGFAEFRPYLNACRFSDCTHVHEPHCAVREAVEEGQISERRYDSYVRMIAD